MRLVRLPSSPLIDLDDVFAADRRARDCADSWLARNAGGARERALRVPA